MTDENAKFRQELTSKVNSITNRLFCTSCQREKPGEGGGRMTRLANGRTRFICFGCKNRIEAAKKAK